LSDDLAKGHNLLYCCDHCLKVVHEMKSLMSQTKGGFKGVERVSAERISYFQSWTPNLIVPKA